MFSYVTHGSSTEMSAEGSIIERPPNCPNYQNCYQIHPNLKIRVYSFGLWGGPVSECGLVFVPVPTQN